MNDIYSQSVGTPGVSVSVANAISAFLGEKLPGFKVGVREGGASDVLHVDFTRPVQGEVVKSHPGLSDAHRQTIVGAVSTDVRLKFGLLASEWHGVDTCLTGTFTLGTPIPR